MGIVACVGLATPVLAQSTTERVRVVTRSTALSGARQATPVGDVRFELYWAGEYRRPFHVGRTDASGVTFVDVDAERLRTRGAHGTNVRAFVADEGRMRTFDAGHLNVAHGGVGAEFRLEVAPGWSRTIELRDPRGNLLRGHVLPAPWHDGPLEHRGRIDRGDGWWTQPIGRGRFVLHHARSMDLWIRAVALEHARGTGGVGPIALRAGEPGPTLTIELSSAGAITGRLVDALGAPVPGVRVLATLASIDEPEARELHLHDGFSVERLGGGGFVQRFAETHRDGTFALTGLRGAEYRLFASLGGDGFELDLGTDTPSADARQRVVTEYLYERATLEVHLLGDDGALRLAAYPNEAEPPGVTARWPEWTEVEVYPAGPLGSDGYPRRGYGDARFDSFRGWLRSQWETEDQHADVRTFGVRADQRHVVVVRGGSVATEVRVVDVPVDTATLPLEIRTREPAPLGSLHVEVTAEGQRISTHTHFGAWTARLLALDPPVDLARIDPDRPLDRGELAVPAGEYRLVVEGAPWTRRTLRNERMPRALGRYEQRVTIVAGETTRVDVDLQRGGRLRLKLPEARAGGALDSVRIVADDGGWEPVVPAGLVAQDTGEGAWPASGIVSSDALPAGTYVLEATVVDGRVIRWPVSIASGQTTELELDR